MKTTDFAIYLTEFLKMYLPRRRELSENTILSYRDTFRFLLVFAEEQMGIPSEKISLADFTEDFVSNYLDWLGTSRNNGTSTKKQRLAAIHVFVQFLKTRKPENLLEYQKILEIKVKTNPQRNICYLSPEEVKAILAAPKLNDRYGRRDMVLLALLYDSAARVQEICDLQVDGVRLQKPYAVTLTGKGQKTRTIPMMKETAEAIRTYLLENNLTSAEKRSYPLFPNHQKAKLTRAGVTYILAKYCDSVRQQNPALAINVSPHILRHSRAMHMLKSGINLIYIRDFLVHSSIATTEVYAKADSDMKRSAIEQTSLKVTPNLPDWTQDISLMAMLTDLCR